MSTSGDRKILNSVVNPLLPVGEGVFDDDHTVDDNVKDIEPDTEQVRQSRALEMKAISLCNQGLVDRALAVFEEAISVAPDRPAVYNNRAQALRLKGENERALEDLNQAISLSEGQGRSACQALCQRGLLHKLDGRNEEAMADFKASASLGNQFAKSLLVQLNPYAAMCNRMLKSVFTALEQGNENVENPFKGVEVKQSQG